jgi:DNA-binding CsgD family transcriptional regulator
MFVGRSEECARIESLLETASSGGGGALVVRGEPGIGKSALLQYACARANGMLVLSARGVESEADLPFAGLSDLLQPVVDKLAAIPPPQAEALAASLALGPPARGDRFAVAAGTLSLLGAAAGERPLLAVIDDVQWIDSASAGALRFALRRLEGERVAALLAVRDGEPSPLDGAGLPELMLEGLQPDAARALLGERAPALASRVAARLIEETRGNPLALEEIPTLLTDEQVTGVAPLPDPLPLAAGIERSFRRRLLSLPPRAAAALVVAAASQRDDLGVIMRAIAARGLEAGALDAAERAGLVATAEGRLEWRHPLLRAAVYQGASPSERRSAHRALAVVSETGSVGERAWHFAAAATGPDDSVAAELERAALDARTRLGTLAAAHMLERAAELSRDREGRARRLLEAANDMCASGHLDRARSLLDQARRSTRDPLVAADIELLRGVIAMWSSDAEHALSLLVGATERIERSDPARAIRLLCEAGIACQMKGDNRTTHEIARRAQQLAARADRRHRLLADDLLVNAQLLSGVPRTRLRVLAHLRRRVEPDDPFDDEMRFTALVAHPLVWIEDHGLAQRVLDWRLESVHRSGSFGHIPFVLACQSELAFRTGRFTAAYSAGQESVRLAEDMELLNLLSFCLVSLARVEAVTGRVAECREHTARALELADAFGIHSVRVFALSVLGLLELGLGRTAEALDRLEGLDALVDRIELGHPNVVQWRADLIEAQVLSRRLDAARGSLAILSAEAARTESAWATGAAARSRGMLADEPFEPEFEEALRHHGAFPFERARTELRLGERLRREKRPVEARAPLQSALRLFEELGAEPWAERARAELAGTGIRPVRPTPPTEWRLTPQELRIAELASDGATNREIAARLFLSPKTVGYHLGKVYAKLGIRSRTQLARVLTGVVRPLAVGIERSTPTEEIGLLEGKAETTSDDTVAVRLDREAEPRSPVPLIRHEQLAELGPEV